MFLESIFEARISEARKLGFTILASFRPHIYTSIHYPLMVKAARALPDSACLFLGTTQVSDFRRLASLLPLDELLRLREPQKWVLRRIWGLGGYI